MKSIYYGKSKKLYPSDDALIKGLDRAGGSQEVDQCCSAGARVRSPMARSWRSRVCRKQRVEAPVAPALGGMYRKRKQNRNGGPPWF
jgi:hypothetical protein